MYNNLTTLEPEYVRRNPLAKYPRGLSHISFNHILAIASPLPAAIKATKPPETSNCQAST